MATKAKAKTKSGTKSGAARNSISLVEMKGQLAAINKAQAVIEFTLDGKVVTANENFLKTLGYTLDEIKGQHHSLFVDPAYRAGPEYRQFWEKLGRGEYDAGEYKRIAKGSRPTRRRGTCCSLLSAGACKQYCPRT